MGQTLCWNGEYGQNAERSLVLLGSEHKTFKVQRLCTPYPSSAAVMWQLPLLLLMTDALAHRVSPRESSPPPRSSEEPPLSRCHEYLRTHHDSV